ncbi:putative mitochondrial protein, partial [Mucuna pruriens]
MRTDIYGPMSTTSLNIINDLTRMSIIIFIKFKSMTKNKEEHNNYEDRQILFKQGLPKTFGAKCVSTSVYLLNMLPTKALKGKTPFEAWYERKSSMENVKVFGCLCYALIPKVKKGKLVEHGKT